MEPMRKPAKWRLGRWGLAVIVCGSVAHAAVQSQAGPAFDVASVKPNKSATAQANAGLQPNGVNLVNLPLRVIIQLA
jgi:hypothetical protein